MNNNNNNNNNNENLAINDEVRNNIANAIDGFIDIVKTTNHTFKAVRDFLRTLHNKIRTDKLEKPVLVGLANYGPEQIRDLSPYTNNFIVPMIAIINELPEPRNQFDVLIKEMFEEHESDLEAEYNNNNNGSDENNGAQNGGKRKSQRRKTQRRKLRKSIKRRPLNRKSRYLSRKQRGTYRRRR
jgi:hypothetical protein